MIEITVVKNIEMLNKYRQKCVSAFLSESESSSDGDDEDTGGKMAARRTTPPPVSDQPVLSKATQPEQSASVGLLSKSLPARPGEVRFYKRSMRWSPDGVAVTHTSLVYSKNCGLEN